MPIALKKHVVSVVPEIKRQDIGNAILQRIERVSGRACTSEGAQQALDQLASRTGVKQVVILPAGVQSSLSLPGGIVLLNRALVELGAVFLCGFIAFRLEGFELIDPVHHGRPGAKVGMQREWCQRQAAQAAIADVEVEPYIRFTKTIDGLHWIADREQGSTITR